MWEPGLPAKAVCQSLQVLLHHRFRRQASSHRGSAAPVCERFFCRNPCKPMPYQKILSGYINILK